MPLAVHEEEGGGEDDGDGDDEDAHENLCHNDILHRVDAARTRFTDKTMIFQPLMKALSRAVREVAFHRARMTSIAPNLCHNNILCTKPMP